MKKLIEKQDVIHLAILAAIALVIGVYLMAVTVLISEDGVYYIERAKVLTNDLIELTKTHPPGYPFLILTAHKFASLFTDSTSNQVWIYSAQGVTLLCRLLALIPLYLIGKLLVGSKNSFWAILILILLPYPAQFVCDVVREWPHLLVLSTSLLFLILASRQRKWWMFAVAGLLSGLGYTIRPDSVQIVLYGMAWATITLVNQKDNISRLKTVGLAAILVVGFAIPAVPFMNMSEQFLPPQLKQVLTSDAVCQPETGMEVDFVRIESANVTPGISTQILKSFEQLTEKLSQNLAYFFVLPLIIGLYCHFRKMRDILVNDNFFILALVTVYIVMMVLLYINCHYMTRRHCLPMIVFTVFYIPIGLHCMANWLNNRISNPGKRKDGIFQDKRSSWFVILFLIGMVICMVRLLEPDRIEKQSYVAAAKWIKENTDKDEVIDVPDARISFYGDRKGTEYPHQGGTNYLLEIFKENRNEDEQTKKMWREVFSAPVEKKSVLVIYKKQEQETSGS